MIEKFENIKSQLSELASVLNAFKSEAVQLRIVDFILRGPTAEEAPVDQEKRARRKPAQGGKSNVKAENGNTSSKKKAPAGMGGASTLSHLIETGFFDKPRTINDIIEHSKHSLARTFKANEFSGSLARMTRTGKLTREKNADKQYEYKKP